MRSRYAALESGPLLHWRVARCKLHRQVVASASLLVSSADMPVSSFTHFCKTAQEAFSYFDSASCSYWRGSIQTAFASQAYHPFPTRRSQNGKQVLKVSDNACEWPSSFAYHPYFHCHCVFTLQLDVRARAVALE